MSGEINKQIAKVLGIEHVTWQEGYYKEQQAEHGYVGHNLWITLLDGDELWGELFPKDWQNDVGAALSLVPLHLSQNQPLIKLELLPNYLWLAAIWIGWHTDALWEVREESPALAVCKAWLAWKGGN